MNLRGFFLIIAVLFLSSCASDYVLTSDDPKIIYDKVVSLIEKSRFIEANEHINELKKRFPQSRYSILADLRRGDLEFDQGNFTEAAAIYSTFVELYPTHPEAAYAQWKQVESHYENSPSNIARDQLPAERASQAAEQLLLRYPKSQYLPKAKEIYAKSRLRLAEKEAYIAKFYERRGADFAAKTRWANLLQEFKDLSNDDAGRALVAEAQKRFDKFKDVKAPQENGSP